MGELHSIKFGSTPLFFCPNILLSSTPLHQISAPLHQKLEAPQNVLHQNVELVELQNITHLPLITHFHTLSNRKSQHPNPEQSAPRRRLELAAAAAWTSLPLASPGLAAAAPESGRALDV